MSDKVQEIKEALSKITPGPWRAYRDNVIDFFDTPNGSYMFPADGFEEDDAHFIAKSPEYITYLLQVVEEQKEVLEWCADEAEEEARKFHFGLVKSSIGARARKALGKE